MSEFKRKKLNIFRKLLIKLGKKFFWWRFPKANKLLLNGAFINFYKIYLEIIKDQQKVDEEWFIIGNKTGLNLINEVFNLIEMMISKSIEDLVHFIDASWAIYIGKAPTFIEYFPADEQGIQKIIWSWDDCPMCTNIQKVLEPEFVKNNKIASIGAGVYKAAFDIVQEHVGNSYLIDVELTKSRSWGDDTCEMTATFTPVER